jgi:putative copper export protein
MLSPLVNESMIGALFLVLLFAFAMFARYVRHEYRERGYAERVRATVSIMTVLLGEMILHGWYWLQRMQINAHHDATVAWMRAHSAAPIGRAIEIVGVLCLIRVFSPDSWARQTWLAIGIVAAIVATFIAHGGL